MQDDKPGAKHDDGMVEQFVWWLERAESKPLMAVQIGLPPPLLFLRSELVEEEGEGRVSRGKTGPISKQSGAFCTAFRTAELFNHDSPGNKQTDFRPPPPPLSRASARNVLRYLPIGSAYTRSTLVRSRREPDIMRSNACCSPSLTRVPD